MLIQTLTSMLGLGERYTKECWPFIVLRLVAKDITGTFLGMEVEELDDDVKDAIGEIANMVAGEFKKYFSRKTEKILSLQFQQLWWGNLFEQQVCPRQHVSPCHFP